MEAAQLYPYRIYSANESRMLDALAESKTGLSGDTLMEIAGTKAGDEIRKRLDSSGTGLYICGKGNNAGDALVIARYLYSFGFSAIIVLLESRESLSGLCSKNLSRLERLENTQAISILEHAEVSAVENRLINFVVDGITGTGLSGALPETYRKWVQFINSQQVPRFSMDIPSGIMADTGEIAGFAVEASYTFAFGGYKSGHLLNSGKTFSGDIIPVYLPYSGDSPSCDKWVLDETWVTPLAEGGKRRVHKYSNGILHIIAGSKGMTGAAILAAKSAWAQDIGAVNMFATDATLPIFERTLIAMLKTSTGSSASDCFSSESLDEILSALNARPGILLIGPGLGRRPGTMELVAGILQSFEGKAVIDADALHALAKFRPKKPDAAEWIFTPHIAELKQLTDKKNLENDYLRMEAAEEISLKFQATVVSKGWPTVIVSENGLKYFTKYDTGIFSKTGFGDVLAGKIAAYLLKGNSPKISCAAALLDGFRKAQKTIREQRLLEPETII